MKCKEMKPLLMDFIYDEISEADRRFFESHISQCESCQKELASLQKTSTILQQWEDVDPNFNVVMIAEKSSWVSLVKQRLRQLIPTPKKIGYGAAYAIAGIFLILAIANTEVTYRQGEFKINMGLFSRPSSKVQPEKLLTQEFLDQWRKENYYLMSSLIQQSEQRQRKERASDMLQLRQDFARQRIEDLNLVGLGLDNIEQNTVRQLRKTDNNMNELIQLINAQLK